MQLSFFDILFPRKPKPRRRVYSARSSKISDPQLFSLWCEIRMRWFPDRSDLDEYVVYWSSRAQKRTLASCNMQKKRIAVARELKPSEHQRWLDPLLYHEMCHAYLGLSVFSETERSQWHGPDFRRLELMHPQMHVFDAWVKNGGWGRAVRSDRARRSSGRVSKPLRT